VGPFNLDKALFNVSAEATALDTMAIRLEDMQCTEAVGGSCMLDTMSLSLPRDFKAHMSNKGWHYAHSGWFVTDGSPQAATTTGPPDVVNTDIGDASSCTPGTIRMQFAAQHAARWTVVGQFLPPSTIGLIRTQRGLSVGRLRTGELAAEEAFMGIVPFWRGVGASRAVVAVAWMWLVHQMARNLSYDWAGGMRAPQVVVSCCIGSALFGIYQGLVWVALYGWSDWNGLETSMAQVALLALSTLALILFLVGGSTADHLARTASISLRPALQRVNSGFYRIRPLGGAASNHVALPTIFIPRISNQQLQTCFQTSVAFLVCAITLAALTGGADGAIATKVYRLCRLAMVVFGGLGLSVTLLILVRAWWMKQRPAGPQSQPSDVDECEVACPICLERVSPKRALVMDPCGHTVCMTCYENAPAQHRSKCMTCRAPVTNSYIIKES